MINWINENKDWFFSGGGVVFLGWLGTIIFNKNKKDNNGQSISSGKNSINNQAGRDLSVTYQKDGDPDEK